MCAHYMLLYRYAIRTSRARKELATLMRRNDLHRSANNPPKPKRGAPVKRNRRELTDRIDGLKAKLGLKYRSEVLRKEIQEIENAQGRRISQRNLNKQVAKMQKQLLPLPTNVRSFDSKVLAALFAEPRRKGRPAKRRPPG